VLLNHKVIQYNYRPNDRIQTPQHIEPARLEDVSETILDVVADYRLLPPHLGRRCIRDGSNLAELVRVMNTYCSNLIRGSDLAHDIQTALAGISTRMKDIPSPRRLVIRDRDSQRASYRAACGNSNIRWLC